jgi:hypothetical protein
VRCFLALVLASCQSAASPSMTPSFMCERTIAGLDVHLRPGALLWFGEMHGTVESPRFVTDVACHAARISRVQLGLEVPSAEQPRIDAYVRSAGSDADRAALLDGPFWNVRDGRSSEAMLALMERVRILRSQRANIDIVAFDGPAFDRDAAMAAAVADARDATAIFVGLSGNVHSRRIKGTSWDSEYMAAVAHLVARGLAVTTFDTASNGGTMWACMSTNPDSEPICGVHPNGRSDDGEPWTLGPPRDASHDAVYRVGPTTASPPARAAP